MKVKIYPGKLQGSVYAPPSKSYAHRLLIGSALSGGGSVTGIIESQDMLATLDCLRALGTEYTFENNQVTILGRKSREEKKVFNCRESGSTLRFFVPLGLLEGGEILFTGSERLLERGIGVYEEVLGPKGISFNKSPEGITISGRLPSGDYLVPGNISSQYITALLMALPLLEKDSLIRVTGPVESRPYIDITLDVLKMFGIEITEKEPNVFFIKGSQKYLSREALVEGDWSNACALLAFNSIGSEVLVKGLNDASRQGDRAGRDLLRQIKEEYIRADISDCPDLGPVLFAAAALNHGGEFTGIKRLRIKESDRVLAMESELKKTGAFIEQWDNRVIIHPGLSKPASYIDSWNDHRIVMAMTLVLSRTGGVIENAGAITKSFPAYFDLLKQLGLEVEINA